LPCDESQRDSQYHTYLSGKSSSRALIAIIKQQVIANLVTVDSEQRLGKTLLQLARTLGKKDQRSIRIELKISHEELSEMVGTTGPRCLYAEISEPWTD
jgi:hypothetical protein